MKDFLLSPVATAAHRLGLTPNRLTALGLCFGLVCGVFFALRAAPLGFVFLFFSALCDGLDGAVARRFHMESELGLFFDSVSDRISEAAVALGALVGGLVEPLGVVAVVGSVSLLLFRELSYVRGLRTDYALFGRVERLAFIVVGLASPIPFSTLCFVACGAFGLVSSLQIAVFLSQRGALWARL